MRLCHLNLGVSIAVVLSVFVQPLHSGQFRYGLARRKSMEVKLGQRMLVKAIMLPDGKEPDVLSGEELKELLR